MPEPVFAAWVEWIGSNALLPAQQDQFRANIASGIMAANGIDAKPDDLMKIRLMKPYNPSEDDE